MIYASTRLLCALTDVVITPPKGCVGHSLDVTDLKVYGEHEPVRVVVYQPLSMTAVTTRYQRTHIQEDKDGTRKAA